MAKRVYIKDNYLIIADNDDLAQDTRNIRTNVYVEKDGNLFIFYKVSNDSVIDSILYADILDEDGNAYTDIATFTDLMERKTGVSGAQDVSVQDQHSPVIIAYMSVLEQETLLTSNVAIDDYDIIVDTVTGFTAGKYVSIFNVAANRFYVGTILSVLTNTLTMDTPMDFAYPSGSFVTAGITNMNVNGSVTPVVFGLRNTETAIGSAFDITRIIFSCLTDTSMDLSEFGDIVGGITRGIVIRSKNGVYKNILNAKTNRDLKNLMFDFTIEPAQGAAQDGFTGRLTFGGQNKVGVVIRLEPGEDIQVIIQDNITALDSFTIIAEGHEVVD